MNRGLARRSVFENRGDTRFFLSLLARAAHKRWLEVHAYTVLTNHFHLLVRSLDGRLSEAMGWIEQRYVRYFNRSRKRDGPLFRGRFTSRLVTTVPYWRTLIRYIDQNAVAAGITANCTEYPHCSAYHYARATGPIWLTRRLIEEDVCGSLGLQLYDSNRYAEVFHVGSPADVAWVVERQMKIGGGEEWSHDNLVGAAPPQVRRWLVQRAKAADGAARRQVILRPRTVLEWIKDRQTRDPAWNLGAGAKKKPAWRVLTAGLFRDLCGLTLQEIAERLGISLATTNRDLREHSRLLESSERYVAAATRCVSEIVSEAYSGIGQSVSWLRE